MADDEEEDQTPEEKAEAEKRKAAKAGFMKDMGDLINHWQDERNSRLDAEHKDALKKPYADLKSALDDAIGALGKAHNIAKSKIGVRA